MDSSRSMIGQLKLKSRENLIGQHGALFATIEYFSIGGSKLPFIYSTLYYLELTSLRQKLKCKGIN